MNSIAKCIKQNPVLFKIGKTVWPHIYMCKIMKKHKSNERRVSDNSCKVIKNNRFFYVIRYDDPMHSGWTVWERVIIYNIIYALDKGWIPVVDMKNCRSIYQEESEFQEENAWEKFYEQPCGYSVEDAYKSGNYILSDPSVEWFRYIRVRKPNRIDNEYLREIFNKYIRLNEKTKKKIGEVYRNIFPQNAYLKCNDNKIDLDQVRLLGLVMRGTDYKTFHHPQQPKVEDIINLAKRIKETYHCDYYFIATEDYDILQEIKDKISEDWIVTYNAGNVKYSGNGYIGEVLQESESNSYKMGLDYLITLYILDRCKCLIGGLCGATIVAKYRRSEPYEYINIIDTKEVY